MRWVDAAAGRLNSGAKESAGQPMKDLAMLRPLFNALEEILDGARQKPTTTLPPNLGAFHSCSFLARWILCWHSRMRRSVVPSLREEVFRVSTCGPVLCFLFFLDFFERFLVADFFPTTFFFVLIFFLDDLTKLIFFFLVFSLGLFFFFFRNN